jgi:prolipoprotein diacylglyceryltransferase
LIVYGIYRFATEIIRPEPAQWLGLTSYQWVAAVMVVGLSVQWLFDRRRAKPELSAASTLVVEIGSFH